MTRHFHPDAGPAWAVARVGSALLHRFRTARSNIPGADWRAWRRTVGAGVVGLFAAMVLLRYAAESALDAGALDWEGGVIRRLGGLFGFSDAVFFQTFGSDITLIILLVATISAAVMAGRAMTALTIFLAALGADLVVRFGWLIWDRPRPDILYDGIASPGFHSFPSGHAAKSVAIYGVLAFIWVRASRSRAEAAIAVGLALAIALVTGAGRIAMGVHWPSDVAAGLLLGSAWAALLSWSLRYERLRG